MFSSLHKFENNEKLKQYIISLLRSGEISDEWYGTHQKHHDAVLYKLACATESLEKLRTAFESNTLEQQFAGDDFKNNINKHLDAFFNFGASALDILACEIMHFSNSPKPKGYLYFSNLQRNLREDWKGTPFSTLLEMDEWLKRFMKYRNKQAHEVMLIEFGCASLNILNMKWESSWPILDDPNKSGDPFPNRNTHPLLYCEEGLKTLLDRIDMIYCAMPDIYKNR